MGRLDKAARKARYYERLLTYLKTHDRVLVVHADHVGSKQMSDIRISLRGKAVILMGKNTTIRTAMKTLISSTPGLEKLLEVVKLNIGFVFCTGAEPGEVRDIILENRVPAPAKAGTVAPVDVYIPAGPTGMDPGSTSFFQALGIPTKIVKGQIEIQGEIHLIKKEDKVTASAATLLQKLDIRPFSYGLRVAHVYDDGYCYSAEVLDLGADVLIEKFRLGVLNVAAMSKQLNLPTAASAPHCIIEGFKHCTALALETDFEFPQMLKVKEMLKNPEAFAAAAATSAAAAGGGGGDGGKSGAAAAAAAAAEESEEEDEADMGFSLFD